MALTIQFEDGEIKQVNGRLEAIVRKLLQAERLIAGQHKPVRVIVHCGALPEDVDLEIPVYV